MNNQQPFPVAMTLPAFDVLLVDDDETVHYIVDHCLRGTGLKLKFCTNAIEAFLFLKQTCVRLVLLDQRLPDMNGDEILEKIVNERLIGTASAFICSCARPDDQICRKLKKLGAGVLPKEDILAKHGVETLLQRQ